MMTTLQPDEYHSYQIPYIKKVGQQQPTEHLAQVTEKEKQLWANLTTEQWQYAYAPDKWTVGAVFVHILETERIMLYRALCASRGESQALPGYDHEAYHRQVDMRAYPHDGFKEEYFSQRQSTLCFMNRLSPLELDRKATVDGAPMSVRALTYVLAGHASHHYTVLREKYGLQSEDGNV